MKTKSNAVSDRPATRKTDRSAALPKSAPKIAFLLSSFDFGGAERAALTLAKALKADGAEVEFLLMTKQGSYLAEAEERFTVVDLACRRTYQLPMALARYISKKQPTVIVSSFLKISLCACATRLIQRTSRIFVWEHGLPSKSPIHRPFTYGLLSSIVYRLADRIVGVSTAVESDIRSHTVGLGNRISVIHNPIPLPDLSNFVPPAPMECGSAKIIFVGRLEQEKSPILALEAFALAQPIIRQRMVFVGDGALRESLILRAHELGVRDSVDFVGYADRPGIYLMSAQVLVLSSNSEGFGNVLVEALHCGLSLVSTDCGGPRDVIGDDEFGTLVPIGDAQAIANAIVKEFQNPRDPKIQQRRALLFSPHNTASAFLNLLHSTKV